MREANGTPNHADMLAYELPPGRGSGQTVSRHTNTRMY
jgi:hypothetical protein